MVQGNIRYWRFKKKKQTKTKKLKTKTPQRLKPKEKPKESNNLNKCFKRASRIWKVYGENAKNFLVVSALDFD